MDSNVSAGGPKCECTSACQPCMGRCGCFFQKDTFTTTVMMALPIALLLIVVIGFMVIRRWTMAVFTRNPKSL